MSELTARAPQLGLRRLGTLLARAWAWLLAVRLLYVLGFLVAAQWLCVLAWALTVRHNGWLYYQGGDETYYYSAAWRLAHADIPQSSIGYGWALAIAPLAGIVGTSILDALPALILLQTLVLLPLGLLATYGVGARIGGRAIGYLAAAGWIVAPFVVVPGFSHDYHQRWVEQFLPQAFGFTGLADFVSMVLLVCAAYLFLRALDGGGAGDAVAAGLVVGFAVGVKPANVLFLGGPLLAVPLARRWRTGIAFAAALVPGAVALALWKQRGLGEIPLLSSTGRLGVAAAAVVPPLPLALSLPDSINLDWGHLGENMAQIRDFFWSMRLVELLPFAGLVAAARASGPKAALLGGWLGAFVLVKGTSHSTGVENVTFFRLLMPAWPAYLLLVACLPLLVPGVPRALRRAVRDVRPLALRTAPAVAAAVVLGVVPVAAMAAFSPDHSRTVVDDYDYNTLVPVHDFGLRAVRHGRTIELRWRAQRPGGIDVFYRVFRSRSGGQPPIGGVTDWTDGIACLPPSGGATSCQVLMDLLPPTRATTSRDTPPGEGDWTYRIGLLANWVDDPQQGDVLLLSRPVRVRVGG